VNSAREDDGEDPSDEVLRLGQRADELWVSGDPKGGLDELEAYLRRNPSDEAAWEIFGVRSSELLDVDRDERLGWELVDVLGKHPAVVEHVFGLIGPAAFEERRELLRRSGLMDHDPALYTTLSVAAFSRAGLHDDAREQLIAMGALLDQRQLRWVEATVVASQGNFVHAADLYESWASTEPPEVASRAFVVAARQLIYAGKFERGMALLEQARTNGADEVELLGAEISIHVVSEGRDKLVEACLRACRLRPINRQLVVDVLIVLLDADRIDDIEPVLAEIRENFEPADLAPVDLRLAMWKEDVPAALRTIDVMLRRRSILHLAGWRLVYWAIHGGGRQEKLRAHVLESVRTGQALPEFGQLVGPCHLEGAQPNMRAMAPVLREIDRFPPTRETLYGVLVHLYEKRLQRNWSIFRKRPPPRVRCSLGFVDRHIDAIRTHPEIRCMSASLLAAEGRVDEALALLDSDSVAYESRFMRCYTAEVYLCAGRWGEARKALQLASGSRDAPAAAHASSHLALLDAFERREMTLRRCIVAEAFAFSPLDLVNVRAIRVLVDARTSKDAGHGPATIRRHARELRRVLRPAVALVMHDFGAETLVQRLVEEMADCQRGIDQHITRAWWRWCRIFYPFMFVDDPPH